MASEVCYIEVSAFRLEARNDYDFYLTTNLVAPTPISPNIKWKEAFNP